jgi:hypothetical protein
VSDNQAITVLREEEQEHRLISSWVPPAWAERTRRTAQQIALQTIEAIKMQLVALNMDPDPGSVILATLSCLQIGLRPDGASGHAYLIPFADRVVLCIGYKGYVALAARSGIRQICAQLVFQGDRFEVDALDNLAACRRYLPGPNASIASPKNVWKHGFAYGVWLDGSCTEPLILSGQELSDRHDATIARKGGEKSYAKRHPVQWARNQMIRRLLSGGQLALLSDEYGGVAPAVLGAQIDAAGEAGKLREVTHTALLAAQNSSVEPAAISRAEKLLRDVSDVERTRDEERASAPRTPAEQIEAQSQARSAREFESKYPGWGSENSDAPEETT